MFEVVITFVGSFVVGILGGLLGVGGGVFLVPFLVTVADLRPVAAVGVSLFCVIGTSLGGTTQALDAGRPNVPLAVFLETFMIIGSVAASFAAQRIEDGALLAGFAAMMFMLAVVFFLRRNAVEGDSIVAPDEPRRFGDDTYQNPDREIVAYRPQRLGLLGVLMLFTGSASGLFGIGGGSLNVPLMTLFGKVPLRVATATSTLTMSVTGAVAGLVHLLHGTVPAALIGASLLGVLPGGRFGASFQRHLSVRTLRLAFAALAVVVGVATLMKSRA